MKIRLKPIVSLFAHTLLDAGKHSPSPVRALVSLPSQTVYARRSLSGVCDEHTLRTRGGARKRYSRFLGVGHRLRFHVPDDQLLGLSKHYVEAMSTSAMMDPLPYIMQPLTNALRSVTV